MDSLYNNTFLPEGKRCNFEDLKFYGPTQITFAEPVREELKALKGKVSIIQEILLKEENVDSFCASIFNYRIGKAESLIKNLHDFFCILLLKKVKFTYSPQHGVNLWPSSLAYVHNMEIQNIIASRTKSFFTDYITETTTFVSYYIKFRFNDLFGSSFIIKYVSRVIKCLLLFAKKQQKMHIMKNSIKSSLNLLLINYLRGKLS